MIGGNQATRGIWKRQKERKKTSHMDLKYLYIDTVMPPTMGQNADHAFVGEFVFLAASLVLARVGVIWVGDFDARRRRPKALISSLKRRCGLTTGGGLYSSCSTGRREFTKASSGRLYRGFVNSILFPRLY